MSDEATPPPSIPCPDCGAPSAAGAEVCAECDHPLAPAGSDAVVRVARRATSAPAERPPVTVATLGYQPAGRSRGGSSVPSWLWGAVGLFALGVILVTAIQIATAPKPMIVPNASKPQLASAESLAVLLRADSTAVGPNVALGNLLYDTGNFGQAIQYYRRALVGDASLIDVQVDLAVSYHNAGQSEVAGQVLEDAVAKRPDHGIAHFDLGVVYMQLGRRDDARRVLTRAKMLDGPQAMMSVVDQLLTQLDSPPGESMLPPGHPPTGGAAAP